jgi:hypothetical protein
MKILISPAKSIDTSKVPEFYEYSVPLFLSDTQKLVAKLKKIKAKNLAEMMHISADLAELNESRYRNWQDPVVPTNEVIPCVYAFSGEVYRGLDAATISKEGMIKAQEQLRILSGLYGMLRPMDLMYPYRLEMGTKWQISPKVKNLYHFWGKKIALELNTEMRENEVVVNLASNEYFKAVDTKTLKRKVITPVFKEFKNGEYKMVMMYAKHARGAMARYILQNEISDPDQLKLYNVDGYQFDINQSTENDWVFVR